MSLDDLKGRVRAIGSNYRDREQRARRLYVEERAASLHFDREREFSIRTEVSSFFHIPYSAVVFAGSAQIGFSIHKDRIFEPGVSDLDAACIDSGMFQQAWTNVIETTRSFTDLTPFGHTKPEAIARFKDQILRRGMIQVDAMPLSELSRSWSEFQGKVSRRHTVIFQRISIAL